MNTAEQDDLKLCRMSLTEVDGRRSRLHFAYLIGTREGIVHKTEVHELGLFTVAEMLQAFAAAGLRVRHDPEGLYGRGLYVARAASASSS
jgi:hypothetical protein